MVLGDHPNLCATSVADEYVMCSNTCVYLFPEVCRLVAPRLGGALPYHEGYNVDGRTTDPFEDPSVLALAPDLVSHCLFVLCGPVCASGVRSAA
jgi:hypothetical protein